MMHGCGRRERERERGEREIVLTPSVQCSKYRLILKDNLTHNLIRMNSCHVLRGWATNQRGLGGGGGGNKQQANNTNNF